MASALRALARCVPAGRAAFASHSAMPVRGYRTHASVLQVAPGPFATRALVAALPTTACAPSAVLAPAARAPLMGAPSISPLACVATFHSGVPVEKAITGDERVAQVNVLLKQTAAITFNDRVQLEAETREIIDYHELVAIGVQTGMSEKESVEMVEALQTAGVLLRFQNAVYLHPADVVEALVDQLPLPTAENSQLIARYEEKLEEIKKEVNPLEDQMDQIHRSANNRARTYLWVGLFLMVFQLAAFIRLTFWELSWDVMEPIGFFVQLGGGILAYSWFMFYGSDMSYNNMYDSYYVAGKARKMRGMDELASKHKSLMRQMQFYEKFLRYAKK